MSENINNIVAEANAEIKNTEITAEHALSQIEKIFADTQHIYEALDALKDVHSAGPEDIGAQSAAQGMADVVRCRETTNQQLIAFYQNVLENTNKNNCNTVLTEKEVFDQIVLLQSQLIDNSSTSLHRLGDALSDARGETEDALTDDQVSEICKVFSARETTLNQMLEFYHLMYSDLRKEKEEAKQAEPESEERKELRREFLQFVKETTTAAAGAPTVAGSPALLPDFEEIWNTVFLGK